MPTVTLHPTGNGSIPGSATLDWSASGGWGMTWSNLADGDDGTWAGPAESTHAFVLLTNMPADFATATALSVTVRAQSTGGGGDDTWTWYAQVFEADETTALTDEVQVASVVGNIALREDTVFFTTLNSASDKTRWDGARLRLRGVETQNMSDDGWYCGFRKASLSLTYTAAVIPTGSASGAHAWTALAPGKNLASPTGLTATPVGNDRIDLSWTAPVGATGYDVERDSVIIVTDHPSTSYSDTGLTAETQYSYRVRARRA